MNWGVGRRCSSDLALLWLWLRPAVVAPIRPLAWEPPYATCEGLKRQKDKKKKKKRYPKAGRNQNHPNVQKVRDDFMTETDFLIALTKVDMG